MNLLSTNEAATRLGITQRRVVALITSGRLPSQRVGKMHVVREKDLKLVKDRPPGRPAKDK
jgi:excisionase family DNA binding protein